MDLRQGDLENIILNALWDLEQDGLEAIYVADIQMRINSQAKKWAYTTVKTVLDRLVDKGLSTRQKDGKRFLYKAVMQRREAGALALQKVIHQYFCDDVLALQACLNQLRPLDEVLEPDLSSASGARQNMFERTRTLNRLRTASDLSRDLSPA
ncbi:MAG: BlaI/MecI/CopY family transcriptional regulator [Vampirovibrionales bacterium]